MPRGARVSAPSPVGALARVEVGEKRVKEGSRNGAPSRLWRSHRPPGRTRRLRGFRPRAPSARAKRCPPRRSAVVRSLAPFAALNTTKHDTSVSDAARLDAVREVVAGLAVVVRGVERAANLLDDALAREDTLPPDTEDAKHGQAAVLDLLELLLLVLLLRVLETERVEATLAKANIARGVVTLDALGVTLGLKSTNEDGQLHKAPLRHRAHGGERVELTEVVGGVRREVVDVREHETKPRELGNTAVLQLRLAVPLDRLERHVWKG
mmetsp:Transcript_109890/g.319790  ORF Transcript_109890/g.319790 Transcript_109890/m.319790 type:complete len:267 (+) Transcript_109890:85-885(+)